MLVTQWPCHVNDRVLQRLWRVPILRCPVGHYFPPQPTRAAFLVPSQLSTAQLPSKEEKASKGDLACVFRVIFPMFDSGYAPLPSTLELFNLEGQRRTGKVHRMYLEGECFGGSFGKTAGEVVLSGGGNAEKWLWVRTGGRGRADLGGMEEPPWLLRVAELVLGPWAGSAAPSSHELPLLPLLALLIPSTSHRRPTCSLFPASCPYRTYPLPCLATAQR